MLHTTLGKGALQRGVCVGNGQGTGWRHKLRHHHHKEGGTNQVAAEESPCSEAGGKEGIFRA